MKNVCKTNPLPADKASEAAADILIPLSALQHFLYCPRQCALIHMEQVWTENAFTAEGQLLHEKADSGKQEKRGAVRQQTGVLLRSHALGLTGKADVIEFHQKEGAWQPFPVEYKRGRPKQEDADRVQLCAQALCLEEMLACTVPQGAVFYGKTRRREDVVFTPALREKTRNTALAVRALFAQTSLPAPANKSGCERCEHCSLRDSCMPEVVGKRVAGYVNSLCEDI